LARGSVSAFWAEARPPAIENIRAAASKVGRNAFMCYSSFGFFKAESVGTSIEEPRAIAFFAVAQIRDNPASAHTLSG